MRALIAFVVFLSATEAAGAEAVQVQPNTPVEICGVKSPNLDGVRERLAAMPGVQEVPGGSFSSYIRADELQMWSFTLPSHRAHPAVVCRIVDMEVQALCGGDFPACQALHTYFETLNLDMRSEPPPATE